MEALLDAYLDRLMRPELRPEGARRVTYVQFAFPADVRRPEAASRQAAVPPGEREKREPRGEPAP